ncbi:MAG: hypothetical protein JWM98_144 [Thermoleophilia bacterium]|nr:hypothetical protein [Thermoleophilia bacterium]
MTSLTSVATWRRTLLVGITALIALLAVSYSAPTEAHAIMDPTVVSANMAPGWVYVRDRSNYEVCGFVGPCGKQAWRWTGSTWQSTKIAWGSQVYYYPYTGSWAWIWTQGTGWLAVQRSDLSTGYHCQGYACPVF